MLLYYFFTAADYDKAEDIADMLLVRQTSSTIIDDVPSKPITDNSCTIIYTVNHKKRDILFLTITLANLNRFL